jgi:hypothetical protein
MNVVLDSRWTDGVWLGRRWGTIHNRVSVGNEVLEVRAIQRRPEAERWSKDVLEGVKALPWRNPAPDEVEPMRVLPPLEGGPPEQQTRARAEPGPKRVYIRHSDLERWGHISNCHRCLLMREGRPFSG